MVCGGSFVSSEVKEVKEVKTNAFLDLKLNIQHFTLDKKELGGRGILPARNDTMLSSF